MRDDEAMELAHWPQAAAARRRPRRIRGSGARSCATARSSGSARPSRPAGPTPRPARWPRRATRAAAPPSIVDARAVLAPWAHAAVRRRAGRRRSHACRGRARGSRSTGGRRRVRAAARRRDRGHGRRRCRPRDCVSSRPTCIIAAPAGLFVRRQGRVERRRSRRGGRRDVAVAHRRAAPAPTLHELRADSQAIMVGAGTAHSPISPQLTVRDVAARRPTIHRRACSSTRAVAFLPSGPLFDVRVAPTLVVTSPNASADAHRRVARGRRQGRAGRRAADGAGVDLDETLALLAREGVLQAARGRRWHVARQRVLRSGMRSGWSSTSLRSRSARGARRRSRSPGRGTIGDARRHELTSVRRLGPDARLDYDVVA